MPGSSCGFKCAIVALRLVTGAGLGADDIRTVERTAETLLATAGIKVEWRTPCASADACPAATLVQVLPMWKMTDRNVCGEVVRDARTGAAILLIYLNRNREVAESMRSDGRGHSALASLEVGHLVGLTVAHELGHALGMPHSADGVMKASPSIHDVIAMRQSRLGFSPDESARMRMAAQSQSNRSGHSAGSPQ